MFMTIYPTPSTDSRNVSRQDRSPLLQTIASRRSGEHPQVPVACSKPTSKELPFWHCGDCPSARARAALLAGSRSSTRSRRPQQREGAIRCRRASPLSIVPAGGDRYSPRSCSGLLSIRFMRTALLARRCVFRMCEWLIRILMRSTPWL